MRILCAFCLLIFSATVFAQQGSIEGTVYDSDKEPIPAASVKLLTLPDSTFVKGIVTSDKGFFKLTAKQGQYLLQISLMGYKTFTEEVDLSPANMKWRQDSIFLSINSILLDEATITAKIPDVLVKGDTIEYNAEGYKVDEGAVLQDLIKKVPGIEIDANGNISANGKPITKILVDGKEFFKEDIKIALENLPVEMIEKMQLYKEPSEMSKLTGIKDGNEEQVINLKVKEEIKQSIFGSVEAGYGSDDKYIALGIVNYMRGDTQFTAFANSKNVPEQYYMLMGGIETNHREGARFNIGKTDKYTLNGSVSLRQDKETEESVTNSQTFLTGGDSRMNEQKGDSGSDRNSLNTSLALTWTPDTLTNIFAQADYGKNTSVATNNSQYESYNLSDSLNITKGWTKTNNETDNERWNASVYAGRKLNSKGRSINLVFWGSLNNGKVKGSNKSETVYANAETENLNIDQRIKSISKSNSMTLSVAYVEPVGEKDFLQAKYTYNSSDSERDKSTLKKDALGQYSIIDTAYTRTTESNYNKQNFELSFQSVREKYNYNIGVFASSSSSDSYIWFKDSLLENVTQNTFNVSPSLRFSYKKNERTSLDFSYYGSTTRPSLSQLSADTTILSAQYKTVGNPNLRSGYDNQFTLSYMKSDTEKQTYLNASLNLKFTFNNVVGNIRIDSVGNTISTYNNVSGNMSTNFNISYSTPLRNKKFKLNSSTIAYHQRSKGYTNGEQTSTDNITASQSLNLSFSADKLDFNILANYSHTLTKNSLEGQQDINSDAIALEGSFTWSLPLNIKLNSSARYRYDSGYSGTMDPSSLVWDAKVSKQFLKKKKGMLSFVVSDILNDRTNFRRSVTERGISDYWTNSVRRYYMLTFSYRFNIFMGAQKSESESSYY